MTHEMLGGCDRRADGTHHRSFGSILIVLAQDAVSGPCDQGHGELIGIGVAVMETQHIARAIKAE